MRRTYNNQLSSIHLHDRIRTRETTGLDRIAAALSQIASDHIELVELGGSGSVVNTIRQLQRSWKQRNILKKERYTPIVGSFAVHLLQRFQK